MMDICHSVDLLTKTESCSPSVLTFPGGHRNSRQNSRMKLTDRVGGNRSNFNDVFPVVAI